MSLAEAQVSEGTFTLALLVHTRVRLTSEFCLFGWCERCHLTSGVHPRTVPTRSRALTWKQDMTGESGLCYKTMNNTRPKSNPETILVGVCLWLFGQKMKTIPWLWKHLSLIITVHVNMLILTHWVLSVFRLKHFPATCKMQGVCEKAH